MRALATLGALQASRAEKLLSGTGTGDASTLALEWFRERNAVLDSVFYDVGNVTPDEARDLAPWLAREGAVLLVPPTGQGKVRVFATADEFLAVRTSAAALTVAGVGSTALGSAAFARDVADALGAPVVGVVSGYGLADLVTEALGGWFWFNGLNQIRHLFEPLERFVPATHEVETTLETTDGEVFVRASADTETVLSLVAAERFDCGLLVGHSKGNFVISEALYALVEAAPDRAGPLGEKLRLVTIGAKVGMPPPFRKVLDVMGQWDWFGLMNSRWDIPTDLSVPLAGHGTNKGLPFTGAVDVTSVLRDALARFDVVDPVPTARELALVLDTPQRLSGTMIGRLPETGV